MGWDGTKGTRCVFETSEFRVGLQDAQAAVGTVGGGYQVGAAEAAVGHDQVPLCCQRYANLEPGLSLAWLRLKMDSAVCRADVVQWIGRCAAIT